MIVVAIQFIISITSCYFSCFLWLFDLHIILRFSLVIIIKKYVFFKSIKSYNYKNKLIK